MAGVCAAAALSALGREVRVLDAGVDRNKQLAGELIHPPGVSLLHRFGLAAALEVAGAQAVKGFAVISAHGDSQLLPYAEVPGLDDEGAAVEHAALCAALLDLVEALPRVTLQRHARVTALEELSDCVQVRLATGDRLTARLVVAADGRGSSLRRMAGIGEARTSLSTMVGHLIPAEHLPHPGYGHVFIEGASPVLAYRVSPTRARVMIDVPSGAASVDVCRTEPAFLAALPAPLRSAVQAALARRPLTAANSTVLPEASARGRVALVGDAAGCCHPLTASGLASSAHDAAALAQAVAAAPLDEREALRRYIRLRQGAQRTRISLATALYQALGDSTPEMVLLRRGLFRYWRESPEGRAASMGLLSTHDARMGVMAREYARVMGYSLPELVRLGTGASPLRGRPKTVLKLMRSALPWLSQSLRSAFDQMPRLGLRLPPPLQ
jgi:2-polyprenyl-6-methoxyphenol hydroxylase-like FAD-dependent oxidoreductase